MKVRSETILVRCDAAEKQAFRECADASGLSVSAWIRERLRKDAKIELQAHGKQVAFLDPQPETALDSASAK